MRLASLLLPAILVTAAAGCIIVIEEDDDSRPEPPVPDAGRPPVDAGRPLVDGGWLPDAGWPPDGGSAGLPVEIGCTPADDTLAPQSLEIFGDTALIDVEHGGGCGVHEYRICWDGTFLESFPVQARLTVQHRGDDPCDAIVRRTLSIDLARLRDAYRDSYQTWNGTIILGFRPGSVSGRYNF